MAPFVNAPPKRPSHPTPNVRDDRDTPLFSGAGWREQYTLSDFPKEKFSCVAD
jgi:hypothetical protein